MNIAFVNATRKWGGVKTWCLDMGNALKNRGHAVYVYGRPGPFPEKAKKMGLNAQEVYFGVDGNPVAVWFFLKEFRKHNIDLCICNISKELRTAGIAAKLLGIPIVQHLGDPGDLKNRLKTWMTQYFLAPRLVTCSEFCKAGLLRSVPMLSRYDFQAIHPGVLPAKVFPCAVHEPRVIVTSCQLDKDKGHKDMFYALKIARERGFLFRCIVVGTGPDKEFVQEQCVLMGLDDITTFTGYVSNVQEQLAKGDIYVLPSYCEALGIALEEAMAQGLACIARRSGGVPEIWPSSQERLLVQPRDGGIELAESLCYLLGLSDEGILEVKKDFYNHAVRTFHIENQAEKFESWLLGQK